jgi:hypothetical protein
MCSWAHEESIRSQQFPIWIIVSVCNNTYNLLFYNSTWVGSCVTRENMPRQVLFWITLLSLRTYILWCREESQQHKSRAVVCVRRPIIHFKSSCQIATVLTHFIVMTMLWARACADVCEIIYIHATDKSRFRWSSHVNATLLTPFDVERFNSTLRLCKWERNATIIYILNHLVIATLLTTLDVSESHNSTCGRRLCCTWEGHAFYDRTAVSKHHVNAAVLTNFDVERSEQHM